ncbi:MAG: hypothetical protein KBD56_09140 [Candidatus Eisenbacteria bacterium]|nr:hypothetical protein [Candidatus Eisenbacteria bacterium]
MTAPIARRPLLTAGVGPLDVNAKEGTAMDDMSETDAFETRFQSHIDAIAPLIDRLPHDESAAPRIEGIISLVMADIETTERRAVDDPEMPCLLSHARAYMLATQGIVAAVRDKTIALHLLQESVALCDDIAYTQGLLGALYGDIGNFEAALRHTIRACVLDPENPDHQVQRERLETIVAAPASDEDRMGASTSKGGTMDANDSLRAAISMLDDVGREIDEEYGSTAALAPGSTYDPKYDLRNKEFQKRLDQIEKNVQGHRPALGALAFLRGRLLALKQSPLGNRAMLKCGEHYARAIEYGHDEATVRYMWGLHHKAWNDKTKAIEQFQRIVALVGVDHPTGLEAAKQIEQMKSSRSGCPIKLGVLLLLITAVAVILSGIL